MAPGTSSQSSNRVIGKTLPKTAKAAPPSRRPVVVSEKKDEPSEVDDGEESDEAWTSDVSGFDPTGLRQG
jgi:hypothetical protein